MPNCRHCGRRITNFDKDRCPYCGGTSPIEENYVTMDMTASINPLEGGYDLYHSKSRLLSFFLALFLGFLGIDFFYRGFWKKGLMVLIPVLVFTAGLGTLLYFLTSLSFWGYVIVLGVFFVIGALSSLRYLLSHSHKDASGEWLR